MNSIKFNHVIFAPVNGASTLDLAVQCLGSWLDAERETLDRLLAQAGRRQAVGALEALEHLHLEPEADEANLRDLVEEARTCLEILIETLRAIPSRCPFETAWGLPGPAPFDAHLRWAGARLEDILATLNRALAA